MTFDGASVLVTGGSRGLGLAESSNCEVRMKLTLLFRKALCQAFLLQPSVQLSEFS